MSYSISHHPIFYCQGHLFGAPKRRAAEAAPRPWRRRGLVAVRGGGDRVRAAGDPGDLADEAVMPGFSWVLQISVRKWCIIVSSHTLYIYIYIILYMYTTV